MAFVQTTDGTRLFVKDWGEGSPVVFVHGWPLNADMWDDQMVPMGRAGVRTIAYDRRGFGRSDQPGGAYDYDVLADDLASVLDALDLRDATLVGFSMGGGEVARYVARHGTARVGRIALVSSVTPFLLKTADNPDGVDRSVFDGMVARIEQDRPEFLAGFGKEFYGAGLLSHPVSNAFLQWTLQMALQGSHRATLDCVRLFSETDFRADLARFDRPTLLIHGASDAVVPQPVSADKAARLIPGARQVSFEGAPHGLFHTHRDRLNAELLAFIRGQTA